MTDQRLRVDGYVRVSSVRGRRGERFISPLVQAEEIERWASRHGANVVAIFEELDQSGRRPDRPELAKIARRIELGVTGGLVVATVDRFGRSALDALRMIRRIQDAGGHFFSARDDFDLASDTGRYLCRELLSLAEFQSDRLSVGWHDAKRLMLERGAWPASHVPFGYRRARSGRLAPDRATAPYVTELFRRRAEGATVATLCRYLESEGVRTPRGNTGWAVSSIENVFRNRAYLGEIRWGSETRVDVHPPLVDAATWQRAQRPPTGRPRGGDDGGPLLRGLVRCASCSLSMTYRRVRVPGGRVYETYDCQGRSAGGPCPARAYINAATLEAYVVETALELLARRRPEGPPAVVSAQRKLDQVERELRRYRDNDRLLDRLDPDVFAEGLMVRDQRVSAARLEVALAREVDSLHDLPAATELRGQWPTMPRADQRATIARIIDCAFVSPGRLRAEDRVTICSIGTAPRGLPRSGDKRAAARPFRPREGIVGAPPSGVRRGDRWTNRRLERELLQFIGDSGFWPVADVFVRAGRADLLQQARLRARDQWWAFHFELPMQESPGRPQPWTDQRISDELTVFLQGRANWPTEDEFRAAGKGSLHHAMSQTGGLRAWAPRFPDVSCRQLHRWTDDIIRREIMRMCSGRIYFPTDAEFRHARQVGLYRALGARGRDWWAAELGLPRAREWHKLERAAADLLGR